MVTVKGAEPSLSSFLRAFRISYVSSSDITHTGNCTSRAWYLFHSTILLNHLLHCRKNLRINHCKRFRHSFLRYFRRPGIEC